MLFLQLYLFVLILSIKDQGRAVEKARGSTGSIRRGVTLEYDEANGFKFPIGDAARAMPYKIYIQCRAMPYKSTQLGMPSHKNSASVLSVTLVMVQQ